MALFEKYREKLKVKKAVNSIMNPNVRFVAFIFTYFVGKMKIFAYKFIPARVYPFLFEACFGI